MNKKFMLRVNEITKHCLQTISLTPYLLLLYSVMFERPGVAWLQALPGGIMELRVESLLTTVSIPEWSPH